ncbi:MAG: GNAT family N-acetyltransferase [Chitinophagaceae bacterium]|nr:GNAT family N-acetyltransferase [Chitinophagaceae bacterium]
MPQSIIPYSPELRPQILDVWERSVLATHNFLKPADFAEIKKLVATIDFSAFQVYCLMEENIVLGFVGVANQKIEMLFLDPASMGKGLGKKLLHFAIEALKADKLDVNEQNNKALSFYLKNGFQIIERTEKDDQGRDYPLLRMKR